MHAVYLAKGVHATTAIEGNTLTEEEVKLRIQNKLKVAPSKEYLENEIDNIITLCNEISNDVSKGKETRISIDLMLRYNTIILKNVPIREEDGIPGELRKHNVTVGNVYKAPEYYHVPALTKKLCEWLNDVSYFQVDKEYPIINAIIKAIITHLYVEWIHPFGDGNGRLGRMLEFATLRYSGVSSAAAHLLSNHYNATRNEYYRQLDLAGKRNSICNFITYAIQGFRDGLEEQLESIYAQITDISWESLTNETIDKESKHHEAVKNRLRIIAIALSDQINPVPPYKLRSLTEKTEEIYRNKTIVTLKRDLDELQRLGLIEKTWEGFRAKKEIMREFIPS